MKNYKIFLFIAIIIIISIIAILLFLPKNNSNDGIGDAGISLEEFKKISSGMTQSEVEKIIDSNNLWNDDDVYSKACIKLEENKNNSIYTYKYKYIGDKSGYAIVTYKVDYSNGFYGLEYPVVTDIQNFNLK